MFNKVLQEGFRPNAIVHLGAHYAQEERDYQVVNPKYILWAECNPEIQSTLRNNTQAKNNILSDRAIYNEDYIYLNFNVFNHSEASSLFTKGDDFNVWYPDHKIIKTYMVQTITLDTLLEINNLDPNQIGYLAISLQGAEHRALDGAQHLLSLPTLKYIRVAAIYGNYYVGGCDGGDTFKFLEENGFQLIDTQRHEATHPDVKRKIQAGVLGPVEQMNLLFRRN